MASLHQKLRSLNRRNSKRNAFFLLLILLFFLAVSAVIRYYILVPLQIMDSSMTPQFKERSIVWMCKRPFCRNNVSEGDILWINLRGHEQAIRKVLALPGDSVHFSDNGFVTTPRHSFSWNNEDSFIQSRSFYVPKAGDTLRFEELNDVEQDYTIQYLREQGIHLIVKTTLWQGEHEMDLNRVGSTKIANRQTSLNEIDFLPWQDRFLIETQIRQSEPGNAPIKIKRQIFKVNPPERKPPPPPCDTLMAKDSLSTDSLSCQNPMHKLKKDPDLFNHPIQEIVVEKDCYYLVCSKGAACPDSREAGFVTADKINGRYIEWLDRFKNRFISPLLHLADPAIKAGQALLSDETQTQE